MLLVWLLVALFISGEGGYLMSQKVAVDWFDPENIKWYRYVNVTFLRMFEISLFLASTFLVRRFPDDLNIKEEYFSIFLVNSLMSLSFEFIQNKDGVNDPTNNFKENCFIFSLRWDFLINTLRCICFCTVTMIFVRTKRFNIPPTNQPRNLYELLCIPTYYEYFPMFVARKHPQKTDELLELLRGDSLSLNSANEDFGENFQAEFEEYLKTTSYRTISKRLKEDANVFSIGVDRE